MIEYIRRQKFFDPKFKDKKPTWHIASALGLHQALCGYKVPILEEPRRAKRIRNNICYRCQNEYAKLLTLENEIAFATGDLFEI